MNAIEKISRAIEMTCNERRIDLERITWVGATAGPTGVFVEVVHRDKDGELVASKATLTHNQINSWSWS